MVKTLTTVCMSVLLCPILLIAQNSVDDSTLQPSEDKGFFEFIVGTVKGRLAFDKTLLIVTPGSQVTIILKNSDEMIHNLLLCEPGENVPGEVGRLALALGAEGMAKQYVPDSEKVLYHTKLVYPGQQDEFTFTAPTELGDYPYVCTFPGHAQTMKGILWVTDKIDHAEREEDHDGEELEIPDEVKKKYILKPKDQAMVIRAGVENTPSNCIAVGLPSRVHYVFDPDNGQVLYGWRGDFLDVGPDRGWSLDRGGQPCHTLGVRFSVGANGCPFHIGTIDQQPQIKFIGYQREGFPRFDFRVDDLTVSQTIISDQSRHGLIYYYEVEGATEDLYFKLDTSKVKLKSDVGLFQSGALMIPKDKASSFTIDVTPLL